MRTPRPKRRDFLLGGGALLTGCTALPRANSASHGAAAPRSAAPSRVATPAKAASAAVFNGAGDIVHAERAGDRVALTFHGAGPAAVTRSILGSLAAAQAQVTVFAVGSWLDAQPRLARLVLDGGHELGNHTYHHLPMRTLTAGEADSEVALAAAVLTRLTGSAGAWFRPSGTPTSTPIIRAAAQRSGYRRCVSYDLDSLDWTDPGPRKVVTTVLTQVRPGSIVSLHLGHVGTAAALPGLLAGIAQRGLRPVTITGLLA